MSDPARSWSTCDLADDHPGAVAIVDLALRHYGGRRAFHGPVATVRCFEDNSRLKELAATPGGGRVVVVDGGGSLRHALLGDRVAADAFAHGWAGVVVHGAVRDVDALAALDLGVLALGHTPRRSVRRGEGQVGVEVGFGGMRFVPGDHLYADADGVLVAAGPLH